MSESTSIPRPTPGRIVSYVDQDGDIWPMIITYIHGTPGQSLVVFGAVFSRFKLPYNLSSPVAYSPGDSETFHSWHWPSGHPALKEVSALKEVKDPSTGDSHSE